MDDAHDDLDLDAFLADAVVEADGKLYALGAGWNVISAPALPARHPRLAVGLVIRVGYSATNRPHRFEIRVEDADGAELVLATDQREASAPLTRVGGAFTVGRPAELEEGEEQIVAIAGNLDGLVFPHPGRHSVVVALDGRDRKRLDFSVKTPA
jgi:hypothetical protein